MLWACLQARLSLKYVKKFDSVCVQDWIFSSSLFYTWLPKMHEFFVSLLHKKVLMKNLIQIIRKVLVENNCWEAYLAQLLIFIQEFIK